MKRNRRSRGLTLIEFAASTAMVSVALVGTAAAVASGAELSRTTAETRGATRASTTLMEQVRAIPVDQIVARFNDSTVSCSTLGASDSKSESTVRVVQVANGSTRWPVYEVTITTSWAGMLGDQDATFVTYVSDRTAGTALSGASTVPADGSTTGGN